MSQTTYLVPLTLSEAVNIEATLRSAAVAFEAEGDESTRHGLHRIAKVAILSAAEARRLAGVMKAAIDRACATGRAA